MKSKVAIGMRIWYTATTLAGIITASIGKCTMIWSALTIPIMNCSDPERK